MTSLRPHTEETALSEIISCPAASNFREDENRDDRSLLIVEDDDPFRTRLASALQQRGFTVRSAESVTTALKEIDFLPPAFAVVDLQLPDGNGLDVISTLNRKRPDARAIVLTGYGNTRNAVVAVKAGAAEYLSKPCTADDVFVALMNVERRNKLLPEETLSADRVRWEHIQRIYTTSNGNVSETARRLNAQYASKNPATHFGKAATAIGAGAPVIDYYSECTARGFCSALRKPLTLLVEDGTQLGCQHGLRYRLLQEFDAPIKAALMHDRISRVARHEYDQQAWRDFKK